MTRFYKIELVMEASDFIEAEYWYNKLAEHSGSIVDIYQKDLQPMSKTEVEQFFDRPLDDLLDPPDLKF